MAIDKETNKSVGGGFNIESSDNSITISDTGNNTKDIKVNWGEMPEPEETEINSTDGSIDVKQTGQKFDLSVPLATEQRNGLLSYVGKYQNDHAQLITTDEISATANIAAGRLIGKDLEFFPENGQMMTWKDSNGDLHLSRYEPNVEKNNGFSKANWRTATYDSVEKTIIIESKTGDVAATYSGKFMVARTDNNGWTFTEYLDQYSPEENWGIGHSHAGTTVFISRNISQEIEFSTDGGLTWTRSNLPTDSGWTSVWVDELGWWCFRNTNNVVLATVDFSNFTDVSAEYPAGCYCYFLPETPSRYDDNSKTSNWVCLCRETVFGMTQNVLRTKHSNGWQRWWSFGTGQLLTRHFPIKIQYENALGVITDVDADMFVNEEENQTTSAIWIDSTHKYNIYGGADNYWFYPVRVSDKDGKVFGFVSIGDTIYKAEGQMPLSGSMDISDTEVIFKGVEGVNLLPYAGNKLFTFGGVKQDGNGVGLSNFKMFITIEGLDAIATPPDFWREIPLIDENKNGLLLQEGNTVKTAELGNFLEKRTAGAKTEIGTVHSDRTTEYANYMLQNSNGVCWCMVDVADMVNNTTKVYSDEECTNEIGVVTNHSYNPNNPLDVEVNIGGTTEVYVIDLTKIPQSLATTAAIIAAINELKKKIIICVKVLHQAYGATTFTDLTNQLQWNANDQRWEAALTCNLGATIYATTDGNDPQPDASNVGFFYTVAAKSGTFQVYVIGSLFTDGTNTGPLMLIL